MIKLLLKRRAFTNEYVERIRKEIPSQFHVTETFSVDQDTKQLSSDTLCCLFGSKQTQKNQMVMLRWSHSTSSCFRIKLSDLRSFLLSVLSPSSPQSQPLLSPSPSQPSSPPSEPPCMQ